MLPFGSAFRNLFVDVEEQKKLQRLREAQTADRHYRTYPYTTAGDPMNPAVKPTTVHEREAKETNHS